MPIVIVAPSAEPLIADWMLLYAQPLLHTVFIMPNAGPAAARQPASTAQASAARTVRPMVPSISISPPETGLDGRS